MTDILPHRTIYTSKILDGDSIALVQRLLPRKIVNSDKLEEGGSQADIDGYLEICDDGGYECAKITVQVKHITLKKRQEDAYYDIPSELYGYAGIHKGEVVVFIACDTENERFFWKAISLEDVISIRESAGKPQKTYRYHFSTDEICSASTVTDTISVWKKLFDKRMESIKDDRQQADRFADAQRLSFSTISTELHGIADSHIHRHQVDDILEWIDDRNGEHLCLLVGNAGVGKSAVLKEIINSTKQKTSKYLCIKADAINDSSNNITLSDLCDTIECYHGTAKSVVLIIDQIDALSQSLSNDRNHLNMMMSLLSSLNKWPDVCAVVSCRRYDLDYDSDLCRLKEKAKIIEIGELTDKEVYSSLDKICTGLKDKVDSTTIRTLQTVQHLNTFCILYGKSYSKLNFSSPTELYDALWTEYVNRCPSSLHSADIEHELFQITEVIRKSESLTPVLTPSTAQKKLFDYLASCGIIKTFNNTVSFFHQSFYEYTLARYYVSCQGKFISDIEDNFQGIETRSLIKAVLEYERGHNEVIFINDARSIIESSRMRLHIKLLAISLLASANNPKPAERLLIKEICTKDERFLMYFLRGAQDDGWFHTVRNLVKSLLTDIDKKSPALIPIVSCLSRFVFNHPDEIYTLVNSIKDNEVAMFATSYLIRSHNDYKSDCVQSAFLNTRDINFPFIFSLIKDAFLSNAAFASAETERVLTEYFRPKPKTARHEPYELVDVILPDLLDKQPKGLLMILHKSIVRIIEQTVYVPDEDLGFTFTPCFNDFSEDETVNKILDMYEKLLEQFSDDTCLMLPIIEELIALKNTTSVSMAFAAMSAKPHLYDDIIRQIAYSQTDTDRYLHDDNIAYFFVSMLKSWYSTLTEEDMVSYQKQLLVHTSSHDFIANEKRSASRLLYPYLWRDKWILICNTLPEKGLIPAMQRCSYELMRRFGKRIVLKRHNHMQTMADYCGGIVDDLTYSKFTLANWINTFVKLEDKRLVSLEAHADAFQKCVSEAPDKFKQFISDISGRQDVNDIYKTAGLKGLLASGESPAQLWPLCEPYMSAGYASKNPYSFYQIADYYTKEENGHIDDIINTAIEVATLTFSKKRFASISSEDKSNDLSYQAYDLLNTAINSPQGHALELLLHICAIPERKTQIYSIFSDIQSRLSRGLKAVLLRFLCAPSPFDDKLYFELMKQLLEGLGPEALAIRGDAIQWCFYHKRDIVADYIGKIEAEPSSHEILAQLYFYGIGSESGQEEYKRLLDKILSYNSENVISKVIKIAFKSYSDSRYTEYSKGILTRFSTDERENIVNAYSSYCNLLPVDALEFFCTISKVGYGKRLVDIHGQLKYIQKCIATSPEMCYKFISEQQYYKQELGFHIDDDIVHILLEIYKKMKEEEDLESMNEIMDMFDEFIYQGNSTLTNAMETL